MFNIVAGLMKANHALLFLLLFIAIFVLVLTLLACLSSSGLLRFSPDCMAFGRCQCELFA